MAGIFGVMLGATALRVRGDYLAIVTLGFGEIVRITLTNLEPWTGEGQITLTALVNFSIEVDPPDEISFSAGGSVHYTVTYDFDVLPSVPPTYTVTVIGLFPDDFSNTATWPTP